MRNRIRSFDDEKNPDVRIGELDDGRRVGPGVRGWIVVDLEEGRVVPFDYHACIAD